MPVDLGIEDLGPVVETDEIFAVGKTVQAQDVYEANAFLLLRVEDDVEGKSVRAFAQLGIDPSFKYWVTVSTPQDYDPNWTRDDVAVALKTYFAALV